MVVQSKFINYLRVECTRQGFDPNGVVLKTFLLPVGPGNNLVQYPGAYGDDLDQMIYSAIETNAHVNVLAYVKTYPAEMPPGQ